METHCGEQNPRVRLNPAILHELYSEHIFRKPLEKNAYTSKHERRKCLNFCEMKNERTTNKLEYCVLESERTLRVLQREKDEKQKKMRIKNERWRWGGGG